MGPLRCRAVLSLTSSGPIAVAQAIVLHAHVATRERVTAYVQHDGRRLADMHVRADALGQELRTAIDTGDLGPGRHTLALVVHDGERTIASIEQEVTVDAERAYRSLRAARRARPPATRGDGAATFLVAAVGRAAEDPATHMSLRVAAAPADTLWRPDGAPASVAGALGALLHSRHRYVLVVEEPGILWRDAAHLLSRAIAEHDEPDAVYGDDELANARRGEAPVRLKPAWSPDLLLQDAYAGPVLAVSRAAARMALASAAPPADVRDVLLAQDVRLARVVHVPRSLFARVAPGPSPATPLATAPPAPPPATCVSVIICSSGHGGHLDRCLRSLVAAASRTPLELVLVCGEAVGASAGDSLRAAGVQVHRIAQGTPFNYSAACNAGAAVASGDELLFLNDDVIATGERWLERMRAWLHRPGVGVVGARLRYPEGPIQHRGVVVDPLRIDNLGCAWPPRHRGAAAVNDLARTVTAVTGACQLVHRDVFEAIGGFDQGMALEFNDVDLPLRAAGLGARTVYAPEAELVHVEGGTRGRTRRPQDHQRFMARWAALVADGDPGLHPALHRVSEIDPADTVDPDRLRSREAIWAPVSPAARRRSLPDAATEAAAAEQAARLHEANSYLEGATIELGRRACGLERQAEALAVQEQRVARQAERLAEQDAALACHQEDRRAQDEELARQRAQIADYGRVATDLERTIAVIGVSRSWRMTAPVRRLGAVLRVWVGK